MPTPSSPSSDASSSPSPSPEPASRSSTSSQPRELFGDGSHPDLPDLTVAFRTDLGPLEACESARVGLVEVPLWSRARRADGWPQHLGRTGDHTDASRLWLQEGGTLPGRTAAIGEASVRDVAPTALQALGVPVPEGIDGHALLAPGA